MEQQKLEVGEKYLTIKIVGHENIVAFKNKEKEPGDNKPNYKSNGVAIWINEKKEPQEKTETTL